MSSHSSRLLSLLLFSSLLHTITLMRSPGAISHNPSSSSSNQLDHLSQSLKFPLYHLFPNQFIVDYIDRTTNITKQNASILFSNLNLTKFAANCYVPEIVGSSFVNENGTESISSDNPTVSIHLFANSNITVKTIVQEYYRSFPNKPITDQSVSNLLGSIRQMLDRCLSRERPSPPDAARYGFTELSDYSLADIQQMLGQIIDID